MKKVHLLLWLCVVTKVIFGSEEYVYTENRIIVVMITSNARSYIQKALHSVFSQNYENYILLVIDDCSADDTVSFIKSYAKKKRHAHQVIVHRNQQKKEIPLINYVRVVKIVDPQDIIFVLPPQDYFAHAEVLSDLNNIYQNSSVWMTYGSLRSYPSNRLIQNYPMPQEVVALKAYRDYLNIPPYLHSFKAGLLKKIAVKDLCYEGQWFAMNNDLPFLLPMLEMAKSHVYHVPNVMIVRNNQLDHHRYRVNDDHQSAMEVNVRSLRRYKELDKI